MDLPIISIAAVIDRTGYMNRYIEVYNDKTWLMCKTAFSILVERAAKFVQARKAQLEIYFESSGKREDRAIKEYVRSLKSVGMPFAYDSSAAYNALLPSDFRALVLGEPRERTKNTPMMQLADLVLYPIAKGGYDPTYPPYQALRRHQRIIDVIVETEKIRELGVKYSCFPSKKQDPAEAGS